jgi:4-hydroxy 2-oxovalerate aldolase
MSTDHARAPAIRLTDTTLRDGSHAMSHQFTVEQVTAVAGALDRAGVPVIEVSHGDGLGGSSFNYGFSGRDELDLISAVAATVTRARLAVLLIPGIGVADDLREVADRGVSIARVATHCTEADIAEEHLRAAKDLGMETVGFLMMSHMSSPDALARQARIMEDNGADIVYVVDSAGAMTMREVRDRVGALRAAVACSVGIHAHENLSLSVANSLAAVEAGAHHVDVCLRGLGAGAGNCPGEVFVAVCEKLDITTGVDVFELVDAAEHVVAPFMHSPQLVTKPALLLGYAGVYGSFLLHAQRAADRFDVDITDILLELGRRRVVGGQEDMIIDVAAELSAASASANGASSA